MPPKRKPFHNMVSPLETPSSSPNHYGGMKPDRKCGVILFCRRERPMCRSVCGPSGTPVPTSIRQIYTAPFKGRKLNLHMVPIVWWVQSFERASAKGDFQEGLLLNGILFRSFSVAEDRKRTILQMNCKLKLFINQAKNNFNLCR